MAQQQQQETSEERQRRRYEERLQERGQSIVPRHQPAPGEYPVDTSETASLEGEQQPHSGCSDATVVNRHPVLAYQDRQRRHHTRRRAQWLFTQAAQIARDEATQNRQAQQVARAPRRMPALAARATLQVQALQMRHGLVPLPTSSSGSYPSSTTTSSTTSVWTQDMDWQGGDGGDGGAGGDGGDGNGGPSYHQPRYGPQASRQVNRYGPR